MEMIRADVDLFNGLAYYYQGLAILVETQAQKDEASGYRKAAPLFKKAVEQLGKARVSEKRLMGMAAKATRNELFLRTTKVLNEDTERLRVIMSKVANELERGIYPAAACSELNAHLTRMQAGFERNARIEGIPKRIE